MYLKKIEIFYKNDFSSVKATWVKFLVGYYGLVLYTNRKCINSAVKCHSTWEENRVTGGLSPFKSVS